MGDARGLALGLRGRHLVEVTAPGPGGDALRARLDQLPLAFVVVGIDRVDGSTPDDVTLDPSAATVALTARTANAAFLVAAAAHRDHPYNLARRVASLGHLSRGRTGLLLGVRDGYAAHGPGGLEAWGGAGLGVGAPLDTTTAADAAGVVRGLEQTWPYEAIVGDVPNGILVNAHEIVHLDHDGVWSVAGPLNLPRPESGSSVLAWLASDPTAPVPGVADLVVRTATGVEARTPGPGGFVLTDLAGLGDAWAGATDGGVLLADDVPLARLLDVATELLADVGWTDEESRPLRERLGLPAAEELPATRRSAFPVAVPQTAL